MKKIVLLLSTLWCISGFAQNNNNNFHFYLGGGVFGQNFSNLNTSLSGYPQYEQVKKIQSGFLVGWMVESEKAVIDFHGAFARGNSGDEERRNSILASANATLDFGYNFSKSSSIRFYPLTGVGFEGFTATLSKDVSSISFGNVLASSNTLQQTATLTLSNTFFVYQAGVGIDFLSRKHKDGLGLRCGYEGSFGRRDWRINNDQILSNAPRDRLDRWFINLQLLIPHFKRTKH